MRKLLVVLFCVLALTVGMSAGEKPGLFQACYQIGGIPGGLLFRVNLVVYTPGETVTGIGEITQAINPPLDIKTKLEGTFTYMTIKPQQTHILVVITGYPIINWPPSGGIGPVLYPNVHLRMVLQNDWKSGVANYKYSNDGKTWQNITDAPVKLVTCETL
jgi:hypothetical protein